MKRNCYQMAHQLRAPSAKHKLNSARRRQSLFSAEFKKTKYIKSLYILTTKYTQLLLTHHLIIHYYLGKIRCQWLWQSIPLNEIYWKRQSYDIPLESEIELNKEYSMIQIHEQIWLFWYSCAANVGTCKAHAFKIGLFSTPQFTEENYKQKQITLYMEHLLSLDWAVLMLLNLASS